MEPDSRHHWLAVLAAGLAVFMAAVDASVALPASRTGRVLLPGCRRPGPPGSLEGMRDGSCLRHLPGPPGQAERVRWAVAPADRSLLRWAPTPG
jgi:hypothetical protein